MGADTLATQGAKASATMIFTMFNRINSVNERKELTVHVCHACWWPGDAYIH